jgi:hypothetical protein
LPGQDFGEDRDMALFALAGARGKRKRSFAGSPDLRAAPKQLKDSCQGDVSQRKSIIRCDGITECILDLCISAEQSVDANDIRITRGYRTRRQGISVSILQHWTKLLCQTSEP